ncbi:hypothetical protein FNH22_04965 [Fulvivirga sp. M361]|uniref:hypothetical protein n=1 Tax=Fulvivirga sp. M361 TaxID=2594266 RepID=UPI00117BA68C|nr:hypothetical protein [Fulvivirga sp. M361]TRX61409.1 hypothetical protein FNH22_04965 [Fulvivirga sp. M361]
MKIWLPVKHIKKFSIYDDVLALLSENSDINNARTTAYCPPANYATDTDSNSSFTPGPGLQTIDAIAEYKSFGIYHTLYVKCTTTGYSAGPYFESWDITASSTSCTSVYSFVGDYEEGDADYEGSFYLLAYNSTAPLGGFHLFAAFSSGAGNVSVTIES